MRARWLKPEALHDRKLAKLGPVPFLVYQALRCMADDGGVAQADADIVSSQMFFRWPTIGLQECSCSLTVLHNEGIIALYRVGEDTYAELTDWNEKEIANPSKFRHPRRPESVVTKALIEDVSQTTSQATVGLHEDSVSPHILDTYSPIILESYNPRHLESQTPTVPSVSDETTECEDTDAALETDTPSDQPAVPRSGVTAKRGKREYSEAFETAWASYPHPPGDSKVDAYKAWCARLNDGQNELAMIVGAQQYHAYILAKGNQRQYAKMASTFFGPGLHFVSDWTYVPPAPSTNGRMSAAEITRANITKMLEGSAA